MSDRAQPALTRLAPPPWRWLVHIYID